MRTLAVIALSLAMPLSSASAQESTISYDIEDFQGQETRHAWSGVSLGAAEVTAGGALLRLDDDLALGMAVPLIALGAVDLGVGSVQVGRVMLRRPGTVADEQARVAAMEHRLRIVQKVRVGLLLGGGGAAALGAYFDSRMGAGVGLGVMTHSLFRLLLDGLLLRATEAQRARLSGLGLGVSVVPTARGTTAVATVSGTL